LLDHVGLRRGGCGGCLLLGLLRLQLGDPRVAVVVLFAAFLHPLARVVGGTADHRRAEEWASSNKGHGLPRFLRLFGQRQGPRSREPLHRPVGMKRRVPGRVIPIGR
jgi:hypothetical protein